MLKYKKFDFDEDIMKKIVKNIRKYRIEKNMTQEELAFYTGLSNDFIRRIECERSNRGISLKTLYKISVVLETPINKFIE